MVLGDDTGASPERNGQQTANSMYQRVMANAQTANSKELDLTGITGKETIPRQDALNKIHSMNSDKLKIMRYSTPPGIKAKQVSSSQSEKPSHPSRSTFERVQHSESSMVLANFDKMGSGMQRIGSSQSSAVIQLQSQSSPMARFSRHR